MLPPETPLSSLPTSKPPSRHPPELTRAGKTQAALNSELNLLIPPLTKGKIFSKGVVIPPGLSPKQDVQWFLCPRGSVTAALGTPWWLWGHCSGSGGSGDTVVGMGTRQ